jgi:hypothetical protein
MKQDVQKIEDFLLVANQLEDQKSLKDQQNQLIKTEQMNQLKQPGNLI